MAISNLFKSNKVFCEPFLVNKLSDINDIDSYSISECATLFKGNTYKGVNLYYLDLTTGSATGTFKDWVGSATVAYCKQNNINAFVTQSSGNTANSLCLYCERFKIKVDIFYLKENQEKIATCRFKDSKYISFHRISSSESEMKKTVQAFSKKHNIPWLPNLNIQIQANSIRADIVEMVAQTHKIQFDYISQAISSGYGIFGFYFALRSLPIKSLSKYRFIGVQQSMTCPYIKRFSPELLDSNNLLNDSIIEKTLFRSSPSENLYNLMKNIINEYGADFSLVTNKIYDDLEALAVEHLIGVGIKPTKNETGDYVEKSGIISLVGVLSLIDNKIIDEGKSVLVTITGGVKPKF